MSSHPPRFGRAFLWLCPPGALNEAWLGDLDEEFALLVPQHGTVRAWWYVSQVVRSFAAQGLSPGGASGPQPLLRFGSMLPLYFAIMGGVTWVLAWGTWNLKNWARVVTLLIVVVSLVGVVVALVPKVPTLTVGAAALGALRLGLCVFSLWVLNRSDVRAAFGR